MGELATVFGTVWVAVALYCSWLAAQQRQLRRRVDHLEAELAHTDTDESRELSRAA